MTTSPYITEQVARFSRQERRAAAAASRVAREASASRRPRRTHTETPTPTTTTASTIGRLIRQRRPIDAGVPSVG